MEPVEEMMKCMQLLEAETKGIKIRVQGSASGGEGDGGKIGQCRV